MERLESFAPGRVCLFGEAQDDLGLSVVALAIDLGVRARLTPAADRADFEIELKVGGARDSIAVDGSTAPAGGGAACDGLRAAVRELVRRGARFPSGARIEVSGDLPEGDAAGWNAALRVAVLRLLIEWAGGTAASCAEPRRLAELADEAEAARVGARRGRIDHLACSLGGLLHVHAGPVPFVQPLDASLDGLVLVEGGASAGSSAALARARGAVDGALAELRAVDPALELASISYESVWSLLLDAAQLDRDGDATRRRERLVFATMIQRDLLLAALRVFAEAPLDRTRIGELLDEQHRRLRDDLDLSSPRLEELRSAALGAGALGAKLAGAGDLLAYAPGAEQSVIAAAAGRGARARVVGPGPGARARRLP